MKFIWEPKDIICGRIICKPTPREPFTPCGWTAKWTHKIGWLATGNPNKDYTTPKDLTRDEREKYLDAHRADYCLVAMTDGMIYAPKTRIQLAEQLNKDGMIPMPQEWFIKTMEWLRHLNENGNTL